MKIRKAVILAAGFGTRFLPITKVIEKPLLPLIDKPCIHYLVDELVASGIEEVFIVVRSEDSSIIDYFSPCAELETYLEEQGKEKLLTEVKALSNMVKITPIIQKYLGSGGAVLSVKDYINEPFLVVFGDDLMVSNIPAAKQLITNYELTGNMQIGALEICPDKISRYGVLEYDGEGCVRSVIEKPELVTNSMKHAGIGRYLLIPEIFGFLEKAEVHPNGEKYLPHTMFEMTSHNYKLSATVLDVDYYDLGNKAEYVKAVIAEALNRAEMKEEIVHYMKEVLHDTTH